MYKTLIEEDLKRLIKKLGYKADDILLSIPENSQFGDYTTNIPLQLSKQNHKKGYQSPEQIANTILDSFGHPHFLERIEIAGPGFINFYIKSEKLAEVLKSNKFEYRVQKNRNVLLEYAQPNTHKEFHLGHFRNIILGESISRLLEFQGVKVFRANYGSDIGLPVAKALWGIKRLEGEYKKVQKASLREKIKFLGKSYALAHDQYSTDKIAAVEIDKINRQVYERDPNILPLWQETRAWSLGYFESLYVRLGCEFDAIISESEIEEQGKRVVEENKGTVFIEDQGAIIFPGEKYGLHNRVFITSYGNPTYEAKELGVTLKEEELFPFDEAIHLTGNEQIDYFKVVIKAVELIYKHLEGKKKHLSFGFVTLTTGKMSSRLGNIVSAESLIDLVTEEIKDNFPEHKLNLNQLELEKIVLAAIKFAFLKYSLKSNIVFDLKQSVSLQGDSGIYVLYTYTRCHSLISKSQNKKSLINLEQISDEERDLLRYIEHFGYIVYLAASEYQPNILANYLLNFSKAFNHFYQYHPVLGSVKEPFRIELIKKVAEVLKIGLNLLGIETVDKM